MDGQAGNVKPILIKSNSPHTLHIDTLKMCSTLKKPKGIFVPCFILNISCFRIAHIFFIRILKQHASTAI